MPLVVQQRRRLSPLERYAVDLVFGGMINPSDLMVEVSNSITIEGDGVASTYSGSGRINISRIKHADAENLHFFTEVDDIDKTRPNNISYLSGIVHHAGRYWQERRNRYRKRLSFYEFSNGTLDRTEFICSEQHASVGQVYFILKWQWDLGIPLLDLTDGSPWGRDNVGPAGRYCPIGGKDLDARNKRFMNRDEVGKFFPHRFQNYLADLHKL
ncbi:hypothetical protein F4X33_05190 [Candidatus Poribacteria bacterium]|nr:hypothetical protein [Candidatus Poribacteria bacterium]